MTPLLTKLNHLSPRTKWCMNKRQFKDPLTSTFHVSSLEVTFCCWFFLFSCSNTFHANIANSVSWVCHDKEFLFTQMGMFLTNSLSETTKKLALLAGRFYKFLCHIYLCACGKYIPWFLIVNKKSFPIHLRGEWLRFPVLCESYKHTIRQYTSDFAK